MYKAMAAAFNKAGFQINTTKAHCFNEGWSTKLSYRTFKKLESEGYTKFNG